MKANRRGSLPSEERSFLKTVLEIVKKIPRGKVLTYGQVASLAGVPRAARIVGGVLFQMGPSEKIPWQRVINAKGGISTYRVGMGDQQRSLLEKEGLVFNREGKVELKKYQWWPSPRQVGDLEIEDELAWRIQERMRF